MAVFEAEPYRGPFEISLSGLEAALASRTALAQESSRRAGEALRELNETLLTTQARMQQERQFQGQLELERRQLGLREREISALAPLRKAQTELATVAAATATQQQAARKRFGEIKVPASTGPMSPVLPPEAQFQRRLSKMIETDPVGASQIMRETEGIFDLQERVMKLEQNRLALAGGQEALEESRELRPQRKEAAVAGATKLKAEAKAAERKEQILGQAAGGGNLVKEVSADFADEELQNLGKSREELESDIQDTITGLATEDKVPTRSSVKSQLLQNLGNLMIIREAVTGERPSPEIQKKQKRITREQTAIQQAEQAGVKESKIVEEIEEEIPGIPGFRDVPNLLRKADFQAVVKALDRAELRLTAEGVDPAAIAGVFRKKWGNRLLSNLHRYMEIDDDGKLVMRERAKRFPGEAAGSRAFGSEDEEALRRILNMLNLKEGDIRKIIENP